MLKHLSCIWNPCETFCIIRGSRLSWTKLETSVDLNPDILNFPYILRTSLVAQMVKNLTVKQETWVWSLGQEDSLEKGMETHSSVLAWKIPWTEKPRGLQSQRVGHDRTTNTWLLQHMKNPGNMYEILLSGYFTEELDRGFQGGAIGVLIC